MTDGFFSRPGGKLKILFGKIFPDTSLIRETVATFNPTNLQAVLVAHSHFDHVMDAPEVARQTGAVLVGSASTAFIGRGWGLPKEQLKTVRVGEPMQFGKFRVTFIRARHTRIFPYAKGDTLEKELSAPLVPPCKAQQYPDGGCYSIHVEHPLGSILVQASSNYIKEALAGYKADVVFLGIGAFGNKNKGYKEQYYKEVVLATGTRHIIPVHWDDFTISLHRPVRTGPGYKKAMRFLINKVDADKDMRIQLIKPLEQTMLFESR